MRVRRVDGKLETRYAVAGSVGGVKDLKLSSKKSGRVETEVGTATVSVASDAVADVVVAELSDDTVGVAMNTPEFVVEVVPLDASLPPSVSGKKPKGKPRKVKAAKSKGKVSGRGSVFDGLFGAGSSLSLEANAQGVKEVITLADRPADDEVVSFRSKASLTGVVARAGSARGVEFVDVDGDVAFTAPQGVMWDSSSDPSRARKAMVRVLMDGDTLVLVPDAGWLRDPATVFPVFVDPTMTVGAAATSYVEANNPNTVFPTAPFVTNNYAGSPMYVNGGYQNNVARSFERLDVSSFAGFGVEINQALLNTSLSYCEPNYSSPVRFSKVTSGWGALQGNLIENASFETPGANRDAAAGWTSRVGSGTATRTDAASQGLGVVGMQLTSPNSVGWMAIASQPFTVTPGEALFVQADLRLASPTFWGVARVEYYATDPGGVWTDGVFAAYGDPIFTHANGTQSGSLVVPAGVKWARLSIHTNAPAMDVDNVRVIRSGNGLISNDSFDQGIGGWAPRAVAGWC